MGGTFLIFSASFMFWPVSPALFGIALILLAFFALEKWTPQRVFIIFSPIVTYPLLFFSALYLSVAAGHNGYYWRIILLSSLLIYSALYIFLLRDFWKWTGRAGAKAFMGFGVATVAVAFTQLSVLEKCQWTSVAEKGVLIDDIKFCQMLKLYMPGTNAYFHGLGAVAMLFVMIVPAIIFAAMVVSYVLKLAIAKYAAAKWKNTPGRASQPKI